MRWYSFTALPLDVLRMLNSSSVMLLVAAISRYPYSVSDMVTSLRASCHLGRTQSAYRFGPFAVLAEMLGLFDSRSPGETHPASKATATAPKKNLMQVTREDNVNPVR